MALEINKKENIEIIESAYDGIVDALRTINKKLKICKTDYEFAKQLIEMPVRERLEWLEEKAYNYMKSGATTEEAQRINELMEKIRQG